MQENLHLSPGVAGALLLAALPVFAQHSFMAERPIIFTATVTGIEYYNPHVQIYLDVMAEESNIERWDLESRQLNQRQRGRLRKAMLASATLVKIPAYRAKDGTQNFAFLRDLTFPSKWTGGER